MALANPEQFVLKPQREGGGNNVYGEDIRPFLEPIRNSKERTAYILMDRYRFKSLSNLASMPHSGQDPPSRHEEHNGEAGIRAAASARHQVSGQLHVNMEVACLAVRQHCEL